MGYWTQTAAAGREVLPDLVRAFALFGIALVNVEFLAWPAVTGYPDAAFGSGADSAAYFAVSALFLLKSYTLFSFMFGVGFAYQMRSAERRGTGFAGEYWRRVAGLLILGVAHVALLFQGDILIIYAILGAVLFVFRKAGPRTLIGWAIAAYVVQVLVTGAVAVLIWLGATFAPEVMAEQAAGVMDQAAARAQQVFGAGTFAEAVALRLEEWANFIVFGLFIQGFGAFSFFLFGLAAVRHGAIADPDMPIWRRARRLYLPVGLVGSALGAWVLLAAESALAPQMMFGMLIITVFAPLSSAGYIGLIAKWASGPPGPVKAFLARGGTATLTAYLLQSLLFSLIFNAYGLGLFGTIGVAGSTAIAFAVALASIVLSSVWRMRFGRGPMEALLRRWTYLGAR
ncbi:MULTISPECIES: DUF418 domain-containing protein [unclassified Roseitalea]|uniref:DUF418 domain-containing protein n=1 Tax=unclassified Roseitalea TaxID=2639107 RepID=UPI00273DE4B6|nr:MULTISPECIES: DUF418 domain-containing protein [unclassified Roseitalea]